MNKNLTMEKDYMENSVKISLYFSGEEISLENVTTILAMKPTRSRKKEEWLVQNEYTCDEWEFKLDEINCSDVEMLFQRFIEIFEKKTEDIKNICNNYKCEVSIIVVIHMENCAQPYTLLSPSTISFLHEINAELIIDIWGYDTGEGEGYDNGDGRMNYLKCLQ